MTDMDWNWFYLCIALLVLFVVAGMSALHWRGCWLRVVPRDGKRG